MALGLVSVSTEVCYGQTDKLSAHHGFGFNRAVHRRHLRVVRYSDPLGSLTKVSHTGHVALGVEDA